MLLISVYCSEEGLRKGVFLIDMCICVCCSIFLCKYTRDTITDNFDLYGSQAPWIGLLSLKFTDPLHTLGCMTV